MIGELNPGLILIVGALLIPVAPQFLRGVITLVLPIIAAYHLVNLPLGNMGIIPLFGYELVTLRVDRLSFIFGLIFLLAAFMAAIYALHVKGWVEAMTSQMYAGSAVGAVFAGDLVTLFVFWEITAITSVFLIWARRTESAFNTGMRYLVIQVGSGVILLAGVMLHAHATDSIAFDQIGKITLDSDWSAVPIATWLILLSFGIKAAFPLLHNWLQDAYPEATVSGTVWLSAFTTKLAIYALARGFAGSDLLVPIGATMTAFPIFYAVIENDLRRVLAYSLNNQLGFMVVGVGIGTELAISGAAAHAFCHIIYKALLFMSMGAVLYRVGTVKGSELGGLHKSMPWTTVFCIIGAASISAFPLFSGFVSKSLIISAAMKEGYFWTWLILLFASAGVFHHSGIKIPYFAFFAHDSGKRCQEAPFNMLLAMAIAAALCIGIGVAPGMLYDILPYDVTYHAYTTEHVLTQLQLLLFSALAFAVLMQTGLYPPELKSTNLDSDWFYRRLGYNIAATLLLMSRETWRGLSRAATAAVSRLERNINRSHNPESVLGRTWPTGLMAFWATVMLGAYLVLLYFR
ncbi:MAG: Na(+)/H(+) antiporter subunit D [Pseudomonadota bacterium]